MRTTSALLGALMSCALMLAACDQGSEEQETDPDVTMAPQVTPREDEKPKMTQNEAAPVAVEDVNAVAQFLEQADVTGRTDIQRVVSKGGIEAWLVEEHAVPLIALEIGFKGGARRDPRGKEGVSYLLSSMLDEGAGELESQAFQTRLEDLAVRLSFDAGRDGFYGSLRTLTKNKDAAFDLLHMALTEPRFDAEPLERMRRSILVSLNREASNPRSIASKRWYAEIFGDHVYGRPSKGTPDTVAALTADDLRAYVSAHFAKENLKIAVVGDIDAETLSDLLDKTFGDLKDTQDPGDLAIANIASDEKLIVIDRDQPQSMAMFGGPGLMMDDPDFFPAYVMNYILGGGGFASRLMEEVREKRGLAYSVSTNLGALDYAGFLIGSVATENERIGESLNIIRSEMERLAREGVSDQELQNAKTYLTGSFPLRFDSNASIANQLVGYQLVGRPIDYINTRNSQIEAVTREDIQRVAKRLMKPEMFTTVVIGKPVGLTPTQ